MAYTEKARERRHATKKLFMNGLLALIVAGGVYTFVLSNNNKPAEPTEVASQELSLPEFNTQPFTSPPDQPLPQPTIPPVPLPTAAPRAAPAPAATPAPAPVEPAIPAPIDPVPVDPSPL